MLFLTFTFIIPDDIKWYTKITIDKQLAGRGIREHMNEDKIPRDLSTSVSRTNTEHFGLSLELLVKYTHNSFAPFSYLNEDCYLQNQIMYTFELIYSHLDYT